MNKMVHLHYPASKLPEELRTGIDPDRRVTVTVEEEWARPERILTLEEIFAAKRPPFRSAEEINAETRRGRDEWDA